jgi:hypothetical protein
MDRIDELRPNPEFNRLQRELAAATSEDRLPRSSDTEVDAYVTARLAVAFERAGWTAPPGWRGLDD